MLALVVDIGLAGADQVLRPVVQPPEIIRGVVEVPTPVETKPAHIALDCVNIFLLFLGRVGIVEAQMAATAEFLGDTEVEANRLGMADVKIAVRLGREAGHHFFHPPGIEISLNDIANEIASGLACGCFTACLYVARHSSINSGRPSRCRCPRPAAVCHDVRLASISASISIALTYA